MISETELNPHEYPTSNETRINLAELLKRINAVRKAYGKPMIITSGLRSPEDQKKLIAAGRSTATKSNHLTGCAVDILDTDKQLWQWCKDNTELLTDIGLWMEERQGPWQHFQTVPPKSKKRWFNP